MLKERLADLPLIAYANARSAHFTAQYFILNALSAVFEPEALLKPGKAAPGLSRIADLNQARRDLLARDVANIRAGLYPLDVLAPESPLDHALRLPRLVADGVGLTLRRRANAGGVFDDAARDYLADVPPYYRRNFHFQTNGYLSEASAELYEHQVEILFGGAADAMRRLVIPPLKRAFPGDGQGLTFLEVGAGTGRATRFVRQAFPRARIVVMDLSDPYLKVARRNLSGFDRLDFLQGDGAALGFPDGRFEAVYSVFMFHELPLPVRKQVFAEARRVLKPGGVLAAVDALQTGDDPRFDDLLASFPERYHEPFFKNYLAHPLPEMMAAPEMGPIETALGLLSKVASGRRA